MRTLQCLRCDVQMNFMCHEKIQLGEYGAILGHIPNLAAGSLEVAIYVCPKCGKLELFVPENSINPTDSDGFPPEINQNIVGISMDGIPQIQCPRCGKRHDFDYPNCPYCNYSR